MINLPTLAAKLTEKGIMDKAFYDMNRDEVEAMVQAVVDSLEPTPLVIPYISYDHKEPVLVVPDTASPRFRRIGLIGDDARKVLRETLVMLSADDDMMRRYLGEDWEEEKVNHA